MAGASISIFFSYRRVNSTFVDRLDADLHARGFSTWVDRRKLEASQAWLQEIDDAIARCNLFLICLSPDAVASDYVRHEFEESQRLGKRLMPVLFENCTLPAWLAAVSAKQWQDFTHPSEYALNLKKLLYAIQYPTLPLGAPTSQLYDEALKVRGSDPERAAILLQHIVDSDPTYFNGRPQRDLADLEAQLYPTRVAFLHASAQQARRQGAYGVEAASLEALLDLGDRDVATYEWAKEYLKVALENRAMLEPYGNVQSALDRDDIPTARTLLREVWAKAPFYRDPAGIARDLGIEREMPITYEEDKERRLEDETQARKAKEATAIRDALIEQARSKADAGAAPENVKWRSANDALQSELSNRRSRYDSVPPDTRLALLGWGTGSDALVESLIRKGLQQGLLTDRVFNIQRMANELLNISGGISNIRKKVRNMLEGVKISMKATFGVWPSDWLSRMGFIARAAGILVVGLVVGLVGLWLWLSILIGIPLVIIAIVAWIINILFFSSPNSDIQNARFAPIFLTLVLIVVLALPVWWMSLNMVALVLKRSLTRQKAEMAHLVDQWMRLAESEHEHRLSIVEREKERMIASAQAAYQQRKAEIDAEHARTLASIAARYQSPVTATPIIRSWSGQ